MQCIKCNTNNRNIAKFCKKCGAEITQNAAQAQPAASRGVYIPPIEVLDDLVGLDELKDELSVLQATLEGMKNNQSTIRYQYNVMILGASGTGKTTIIPQLIADLFIKYNMITKSKPITADGGSLDSMPDKDINNLFSNAKGGIVFIDNAHKLVDTDGRALPAFLKFKNKMDENKDDPIIIMAGLPFGLREFIKSSESKDITGRFQKIFIIPDYTPAQLCAITEHTLFKQHGLGFSPESHEHLMNRFRYLFKELKKPDSGINAVNGYLAINEAHSITGSFYRRKPDSKIIIPDDITGKVEIIKDIQKIMEEMNDIIGMDTIKNEIGSLFTQLKQNAALEKMGKKTEKPAHHFVITGNPGTGKTTIARLLGNIFDGMGLLESGHVVEVDRSKLVAGFVGQTAPLTNANCDKAMGGILFIDEVYTLKQDDGDKFGQECIDTLLKRMEDDRGKFMVVVAGYKSPMEKFLTSNEGLKSRFTKYFNLEDYNPDELTRIFESLAKNQEYILQPEAKTKITAFFRDRCARKTKDFANGREARNLLEEAKKSQAVRLASSGASGLSEEISLTLMPEDIPGTTSDNMVTLEEALTELNKLTGLKSVKDTVAKIANTLKAQKVMGRNEVLSRHFVFTGNPGTGKTTVARILGDVFKALGLLPTSTLVETDRSKMIAAYSGQTAPLVNTQCDNAMGGILFVDEAYSLKQGQGDSYGQEAVDTLLKRMEDDRGKFIVIAAGYSKEMDEFLSSNTGFKSRFTDYINFDDYNPGEMFEIFMNLCKKENYETAPGFEQAILNKLKGMYASRTPSFANARDVRKLFEKVVENISTRIVRMVDSDLSVEEIRREGKILRSEDVDPGEKVLTTEEALKDLNELEGLKSVKDTVKKIANTLQAKKLTGDTELLSKHFVFYGNPGTGKTTVARIMGEVFKSIGLLPTNKIIETDRSKMIGQYTGHTAPLVNKQCDLAMGGILFVDEAYSLKQGPGDQFGQEAVDALLKRMEDDRGKFVVIAAGYTTEMKEFLASNSGFKSRFSDYLTFEDYTPAEMYNIFMSMCKKKKFGVGPGFEDALRYRLNDIYESRSSSFANARTVRQLFDKTKENLDSRVFSMKDRGMPDEDVSKALSVMLIEDIDQTVD